MKTLIYGPGPIGQWLALRLTQAGADVSLLELADDFRSLTTHTVLATPTLNELIESVRWYESIVQSEEVA